MKGFSRQWCHWIDSIIHGGHVGIKVNDQVSQNFQTKKGLRQGDSLSLLLFNTMVNMLAILINRAKNEGYINGVVPHLVDNGLSILQYADDTIIFLDHDLQRARNLKVLLCAFEQLSGLKINYHKSENYCCGEAKEVLEEYSNSFRCQCGTYPFKYLGIPMHHKKLSNNDWKIIEQRIEKKFSSWKGKHLSVGCRLVLINSVLTRLVMFMLSFFEVPRGVLKKIDYYRFRFYWQSDQHKKKYRLMRWNIICQPKEQGGLGIQNINVQNRCLLSKWLFKLINEGIWQKLLKRKYLRSQMITQVQKKPGDSQF
jgi:hypothetical protein